MMTTEQIEILKNNLESLKTECIRVLSYFKDLEGYKIENFGITPDYCTIITDGDDSYVYCEEIGDEYDTKGCVFNPKYLTYTNKQLKDYVFEENLKYYEYLDNCNKKENKQYKTKIMQVLNSDKTNEEKYNEIDKIINGK